MFSLFNQFFYFLGHAEIPSFSTSGVFSSTNAIASRSESSAASPLTLEPKTMRRFTWSAKSDVSLLLISNIKSLSLSSITSPPYLQNTDIQPQKQFSLKIISRQGHFSSLFFYQNFRRME